jgi:uncharacterized protein (TIGR02284 family)
MLSKEMKMVDNNDVIAALNELIETSRDGVEGFRTSAESAEDKRLKDFFLRHSKDIDESVRELQDLVRSLGGEPVDTTSISGTLHRRWIEIKAALTNHDNIGVLKEVEHAEYAAQASYQDMLEIDLPDSIKTVIVRQLEGIKRNHALVKQLRENYDAKSAIH